MHEQESRGHHSRNPQDRVAGDQNYLRHTTGISGAVPRNIAGAARASSIDRWIAIVGNADPVTSPKRVLAVENAPDRHSPHKTMAPFVFST